MSVVVRITQDGKEVLYFRVKTDGQDNLVIERPDHPTIRESLPEKCDTIEDQAIAGIHAIRREDDRWQRLMSDQES